MKEEMKNVTKNELQCEIVQDLLPLYHDDVVNIVTKQAIKQHLDGCENCTKEYQELCEEFPKDNKDEETTKSRFDNMKKRFKKKQAIKTTLIASVACFVVVLVGYLLLNKPVVSVEDEMFEVQAAYRVETEDRAWIFLWYIEPAYSGFTSTYWKQGVNEQNTVIYANLKRPIVSSVEEEKIPGYYVGEIDQNAKTVTFGGRIVWSEKENGDDEIPAYVYEFVEADEKDMESISSQGSYTSMIGEDYIQIEYIKEGKYIEWDATGNIICEGYYEDAPSKYLEGTVLRVDEDYMLIQPFSKYWITNVTNVILVSMNTEDGQSPKDFEGVSVGDTVGVRYHGMLLEEPEYQINTVSNIVLDVVSDK